MIKLIFSLVWVAERTLFVQIRRPAEDDNSIVHSWFQNDQAGIYSFSFKWFCGGMPENIAAQSRGVGVSVVTDGAVRSKAT